MGEVILRLAILVVILYGMTSEGSVLCCCEYLDMKNERNHILACCCNCEDLDEGFESLVTGKGVPSNRMRGIMCTIQDRLRIPWRGGARQISVDAVLPLFILPTMLLLAAISFWWTVLVFSTMSVFLLYIYYFFMKRIPQTKFFLIWSLTSVVVIAVIFEFVVIPFLLILVEENVCASIVTALSILCVYKLRVRTSKLPVFGENHVGVSEKTGLSRTCNCPICVVAIPEKDHHCVWYDSCIGYHNRGLFMLSLLFGIMALLYGSDLTLTSVCHPFLFHNTFLLPDDCNEVYRQYELGLSFVTAIYSLAVALVMLILLLYEAMLVSLGITGQEWSSLPLSVKLCCGITASRPYSRGFSKNWKKLIKSSVPSNFKPVNQY